MWWRPVQSVIYVPDPEAWRREGTPGGLSLLERQILQLASLEVMPPLLLVPAGDPEPVLPARCRTRGVVRVAPGARDPWHALVAAVAGLPADFLFLAADRLADLRVIRALVHAAGPLVAVGDGGLPQPVARLRALDVQRHGTALPRHLAPLVLDALPRYVPDLRGEVRPFVLAVRTAAERRAAWNLLLDGVQKRALDLPGQYFDTPFENFLVRRLAPTTVTPNQVTLATILLAAVAGVLFMHGWLRTAVLLALAVGVLDGVDGKLARLTFTTSRIGALEHVADFFYENFWYLALAAHLHAATGRVGLWYAGMALVALDLADNLLYLAVRRRTGRTLDELSTFDRRFRRVAGRRNVYVMTFAFGVLAGAPAGAFVVAAVWAGVTVAVHALRACVWWTGVRVCPPATQVSEIEPTTGLTLSEK